MYTYCNCMYYAAGYFVAAQKNANNAVDCFLYARYLRVSHARGFTHFVFSHKNNRSQIKKKLIVEKINQKNST